MVIIQAFIMISIDLERKTSVNSPVLAKILSINVC